MLLLQRRRFGLYEYSPITAPKEPDRMFASLLPKGAPFFELLLEQNEILCAMTEKLVSLIEGHAETAPNLYAIAELEKKADKIELAVTRHLSQTFITPIDREDILHINKAHEDAIDHIHNLSNRFYVLDLERPLFPMIQLSRTLCKMAPLTNAMLVGLSKKMDSHNSRMFWSLRAECEMLLSTGLAELHDNCPPTPEGIIKLLKWNQVYDRLELAVNQVVKLAETIEEAVLKNV